MNITATRRDEIAAIARQLLRQHELECVQRLIAYRQRHPIPPPGTLPWKS